MFDFSLFYWFVFCYEIEYYSSKKIDVKKGRDNICLLELFLLFYYIKLKFIILNFISFLYNGYYIRNKFFGYEFKGVFYV